MGGTRQSREAIAAKYELAKESVARGMSISEACKTHGMSRSAFFERKRGEMGLSTRGNSRAERELLSVIRLLASEILRLSGGDND